MAESIAPIKTARPRTGEIDIPFDHKSSSINAVNERNQIMATATIDIKVLKIHRLVKNNKIKGFADISINDALLIKGVRIIEGKTGLFVSMPSEQGKDEKWYERVRCLNKDVRTEVANAVLEAYNNE